jgi:hypothetical protein
MLAALVVVACLLIGQSRGEERTYDEGLAHLRRAVISVNLHRETAACGLQGSDAEAIKLRSIINGMRSSVIFD